MGAGWTSRGSSERRPASEVRRLESRGADVGAQLQRQEEVPVKAGNPEAAREAQQTPTRAKRPAFPKGRSCPTHFPPFQKDRKMKSTR